MSAEDDASVERMIADQQTSDRELAVARAGCVLLDRERSAGAQPLAAGPGVQSRSPQSPSPDVEALKRWCAARLHDRAYRSWAVFRFPETLDYWNLVEVQRPEDEIATFTAAGAVPVSLGPQILRTETAGPILAALALYQSGDLEPAR